MKFLAPVVGMHFRPPAKVLLNCLPGGSELLLEREPDNHFDPNAIKVCIRSAQLPASQHDDLAQQLPPFGFTLQEVLSQAVWQLGYIAREYAVQLAPILDADTEERAKMAGIGTDYTPIRVRLTFDAKGKPLAEITLT